MFRGQVVHYRGRAPERVVFDQVTAPSAYTFRSTWSWPLLFRQLFGVSIERDLEPMDSKRSALQSRNRCRNRSDEDVSLQRMWPYASAWRLHAHLQRLAKLAELIFFLVRLRTKLRAVTIMLHIRRL